jgi:hypothetical protein
MGHLRASRRPPENVGISNMDDDSASYFFWQEARIRLPWIQREAIFPSVGGNIAADM